MDNAILIGLSREMALSRQLDVVANNIANVNTTGFKADGSLFEEYLSPIARDNELNPADRPLSFVTDRATWHNLSQGLLQNTGNPLDVAIDGKGFFVVQTANGPRYTRNGAFQIDANGNLVTSSGEVVMGDSGLIQFQPNDNHISIEPDGTIRVREGANATTDSIRGKLQVVTFANPGQLQKSGNTSFAAPKGVQPQTDANVRVTQGAIEKSNVQPVIEMTRMIEISRAYTQVANMLQQQANLQQTSVDKLAAVPT